MSKGQVAGRLFRINPENIEVLDSPSSFKNELFSIVKNAKKRVCISSLYVDQMDEFNDILKNILEKDILSGNNDLKIKFVLDLNRAIRSRIQFEQLAENIGRYPKSFSLSLFRIPGTLDIYKYRILPGLLNTMMGRYLNIPLINEIIGVYHIKLYIADDNIIISGANLNTEYLSDRQDRYIIIRGVKHICDYFEEVIDLIGSYSYKVLPNKEISRPCKKNIYQLKDELLTLSGCPDVIEQLGSEIRRKINGDGNYKDCVLMLFFQLSKIKIESEESVLQKLLSIPDPESTSITIVSPYLNLPDYFNKFLKGVNSLSIISGVPLNPGKGILQGIRSLLLPIIYDDINQLFIHKLAKEENCHIDYNEYNRQNWSLHFKGIYIYRKIKKLLGNADGVKNTLLATTLGSSNYNERSKNRDFECSFVLIPPENHPLEDCLNNELGNLRKHTIKHIAPIITLRRFLCIKLIKYLKKYL
ncbi:silencer-associated factor [Cryptosporidium bovis]|uniref:silencer-associated factor n=1 Tax=Cryptosporidium bovis TaxID=310047 RepID=UPI00351A421D|nr:silencer-associated factor [Cryptosporidium bovis]